MKHLLKLKKDYIKNIPNIGKQIIFFYVEGNQILRFKTIEENEIRDGLEVVLVVPSKLNKKYE